MKKTLPFFISAAITAVIMVTLSFFITDDFQAKSTLISGLIATVVIVAIPIYDINRWSLATRSLVHFLVMLATVLPLLFYSGWFSPLVAIGVFLLCGVIGWTIGFVVSKRPSKASSGH